MPGKCPKCGMRILKRTSRKGYTFYACEKLKECGFLTWDVPVAENCSQCGWTLFKTSGRGYKKPFCVNENCKEFLPEDKRSYKKKPEQNADGEKTESSEKTGEKKVADKTGKPANKKPANKTGTQKKKR
jgi:DNA topoisomerase-1